MNLNYRNSKNAQAIAQFWGKPIDNPGWYKINALSDGDTELLIYDVIGYPYNDAGDFIRAMTDIKSGKITVRINSPGGDVWDGVAIFNAIKAHPLKPTTRIESLAASIAGYISLAGSEKQAYKNSMIMAHRPWTFTVGNEDDHAESMGVLQQLGGIMIDTYSEATGLGKREITDILKGDGKKDGTWMTAKQAKDKGFIDTIIEAGKPVKAQFDLSVFANIPDQLIAKSDPDIRDIEKVLREAGLSKNKAKAVLARGWHAEAEEKEEPELKKTESNSDATQWDAGVLARLTKNIELLSKGT